MLWLQALQGLQGYGASPEALGLGLQQLAQARAQAQMYGQAGLANAGNGYDRPVGTHFERPYSARDRDMGMAGGLGISRRAQDNLRCLQGTKT